MIEVPGLGNKIYSSGLLAHILTILYINAKSNHPPSTIKNIAENVTNRLTRNSANEGIFDAHIPPYKQALISSGHSDNIKFDHNVKQQQQQQQRQSRKKTRGRRITWFNPPYSLNVKTNIGKIFLQLVKECFPPNHILHKICNKNTLKISYRTMPNMGSHISKHNNKILSQNLQQNLSNQALAERGIPHCNCQRKAECVMADKCVNSNMVYRYNVKRSDNNTTEAYTGCTWNFKKRHDTHMRSVAGTSNSTTLSSHIKSLRSRNIPHDTSWEFIEHAAPFNPATW